MRPTLIILVVLASIEFAPKSPAMFGHVHTEKERRQEAEQRVIQERQNSERLSCSNQHLHVTTSILSAGVVTALIAGAAIGSKTKKDHDANL